MSRYPGSAAFRVLPTLLAALACAGCASLAEDVATHLAAHDVKAIEQDVTLVEGDLAAFKKCLGTRGGSCNGDTATPLPHSSQHKDGKPVTRVDPGGSKTLADSVAELPAGHPAKVAHEVLSHPLTRQAAALHDHLRGHDVGAAPGISVTRGQGGHGGPESTVTMDLKLGQTQHFHNRLLASIGRAWDALHGHCQAMLKSHRRAQDFDKVEADCRRAAFVRGYLGAYLRHGEFVRVDVQLAGAIKAINQGASELEGDIQSVRDRLTRLEDEVTAAEKKVLKELAGDAREATAAVKALVAQVDAEVTRSLGRVGAAVAADIVEILGVAEVQTDKLANLVEADAAEDVRTVAADLNRILKQIDAALAKLQAEVEGFDLQLVQDIDDEVAETDQALSNVFKVSKVGFVSRDATFFAKLPTLEVTVDPTVKRLLTLTDVNTGQLLTTRSDFAHLGVASDTSGVGTGASIGAELVRVFLEAIFDAHEGLPAVVPPNMNGVRPTGVTLGSYSLPVFQAPTGHIDSHDLTHMTHLNHAVAVRTRLLVGRVISGVGPFSLNNPPLESLITEIVATSVRKAMEKASWCWYGCNLDVDVAKLAADVKKAAEDKLREEEKKLQAAIDKAQEEIQKAIADGDREARAAIAAEEKKLQAAIEAARKEFQMKLEEADRKGWAWIDREAEHVKLRLKLSR